MPIPEPSPWPSPFSYKRERENEFTIIIHVQKYTFILDLCLQPEYNFIEDKNRRCFMSKVVTYSVKIDSDIRDRVAQYCDKRGIKIRRFVESALLHEIKLESARDEAFNFDKAFDNYEERKKQTGTDFLELMDKADAEYGSKPKSGKKKK